MSPIKTSTEQTKLVGSRLKEGRTQLNLSQKEFAARMNMTSGYISELEYGKARPSFDFLTKLAELFQSWSNEVTTWGRADLSEVQIVKGRIVVTLKDGIA